MRIIGEILHPECKISLFSWNNRYLIKLEQGLFEQTFKIDQFELSNESELQKMINEEFIRQALDRFESMTTSLRSAMDSLG